uniref:Uncharacterized protein n=1 Tax=Rhizophora mucronata TaxID=61149 RepID=A0A2P2JX72_RHIMU
MGIEQKDKSYAIQDMHFGTAFVLLEYVNVARYILHSLPSLLFLFPDIFSCQGCSLHLFRKSYIIFWKGCQMPNICKR